MQNEVREAKHQLGRMIARAVGQKDRLKRVAKETGYTNETLFRIVDGRGDFERNIVRSIAIFVGLNIHQVNKYLDQIYAPAWDGPRRFRRLETVKRSPRCRFR